MFSQIALNLTRPEIVIAVMAIRKDGCSINFLRRRVFTQPPRRSPSGRGHGPALVLTSTARRPLPLKGAENDAAERKEIRHAR